jgi:hypothetical protein
MNVLDFITTLDSHPATNTVNYNKLKRHYATNPLSLNKYCALNSIDIDDSGRYVTMESLISSLENREFQQFAPIPQRIFSIGLNPTFGVLVISKIIQDIEVGIETSVVDGIDSLLENELFEICGGTHRLLYRVLAYYLSGHDISSDEFLSMLVKVRYVEYSIAQILTSNDSRRMPTLETARLKIGQQKIEYNVESLIESAFKRDITYRVCWGQCFSILNEQHNITPLKTLTVASIGYAILKKLTDMQYSFPSSVSEYTVLIHRCFYLLPEAFTYVRDELGISRVAQFGLNDAASYIANRLTDA